MLMDYSKFVNILSRVIPIAVLNKEYTKDKYQYLVLRFYYLET